MKKTNDEVMQDIETEHREAIENKNYTKARKLRVQDHVLDTMRHSEVGYNDLRPKIIAVQKKFRFNQGIKRTLEKANNRLHHFYEGYLSDVNKLKFDRSMALDKKMISWFDHILNSLTDMYLQADKEEKENRIMSLVKYYTKREIDRDKYTVDRLHAAIRDRNYILVRQLTAEGACHYTRNDDGEDAQIVASDMKRRYQGMETRSSNLVYDFVDNYNNTDFII